MAEAEKATDPVLMDATKTDEMNDSAKTETAETKDTPANAVVKTDSANDDANTDANPEETVKLTEAKNGAPDGAKVGAGMAGTAGTAGAKPEQTGDTAKPETTVPTAAENGKPDDATAEAGTADTKPETTTDAGKPEAAKPAPVDGDKPADGNQPVTEVTEVTKATANETSAEAESPPGGDDDGAAAAVEQDLGAEARAHYEFAAPLVKKSPTLERLESATERLVAALQSAPEEKSTTRGYGELALLYGQALLGFVVRGATDADVLGTATAAGDDVGEDEVGKEEADDEKEDTTEELCWTQLEVARLAFQKSGTDGRLCIAIRTIGEFLLTCDQASAAGEEFGSAAKLCSGRDKADCLYKRYLSLRRVSVEDARASLRDAIGVMEGIEGTAGVVSEMRGELEALPGGDEKRGMKRDAEVTVTRVTPKRRK